MVQGISRVGQPSRSQLYTILVTPEKSLMPSQQSPPTAPSSLVLDSPRSALSEEFPCTGAE